MMEIILVMDVIILNLAIRLAGDRTTMMKTMMEMMKEDMADFTSTVPVYVKQETRLSMTTTVRRRRRTLKTPASRC